MLVDTSDCIPIFRCPRTKQKLIRVGDKLICSGPKEDLSYSIMEGLPVLVDFENSILSENEIKQRAAASVIERKEYQGMSKIIKRLLSPAKKSTQNNVAKLIELLSSRLQPTRLLMVGGGSIGQGMDALYAEPSIHVYAFDIYASRYVQFVADAHQLPLPDDYFDAVVIQAVLEHVLQPVDVVAELWRVLKIDGLIYSETPFMQQVHEGPYDFTRFTESGHRYLFKRFDLISSGASGGPGIQFMWSIDYLVRGIFRSVAAGKLAKLVFFWVQYLDKLIPSKYAVDAASGVFFLGKKTYYTLQPKSMVSYYKGAQ